MNKIMKSGSDILRNNIFQSKLFRLNVTTLAFLGVFVGGVAYASEGSDGASHGFLSTLLFIAIILLVAKLSSLVEKIGQPSVLGELVAGIILGNAALVGINIFDPIKSDIFIPFLAELGVIILLFQVGLESNIKQMQKVGLQAFLVAAVGVVVPFILGAWIVGPWVLPGLSNTANLFLGAALTATSVGITARVFKDLGKIKIPEAQIVLGAAVIDDVIGLIIFAVVSALATLGAVSFGAISWIIAKAILFLVGAIVVGQFTAPSIGKFFSKINTGVAMKFTLAIVFALVFAFVAGKIGLAPIVGAFAAGLILDPVHFSYFKKPKAAEDIEVYAKLVNSDNKEQLLNTAKHHNEKHVEELIEPLAHFFVPIFFVVTGMSVDLKTLANPKIILVALAITLVAFVGKYVAGFAAGKVNKHIVGVGMIPRGEVGLIFATAGQQLGVISAELFSVIVIMVILTTLITPPILSSMLKRKTI